MVLFKRSVEKNIEEYLQGNNYKIFFLWGPRRSGKTTLLEKIGKQHNVRRFNFDLQSDRELFVPERQVLEKIASEQKLILIDEVQNYPQATVALKILHDEFRVKIIATGSSELRQKGTDFDTLAGRFTQWYCLPLSISEIVANTDIAAYEKNQFQKTLQQNLQIFGAYPEVYINNNLSDNDKTDLLQNMLDTYVLKDVITIYDLKNEKLAKDILTKIALQIGSEVSVREIANSLGANVATVSNYIEIFIKNYILIPLPSFKTNLRRAISENRKLYFYDLGIRNILIKDFRELHLRPDQGGLFENFIVSELEKERRNRAARQTMYFYREYGGQEVDLVLEDYQKNYTCLEIKVQKRGTIKDVFPLPHKLILIDTTIYAEKINEVLPQ